MQKDKDKITSAWIERGGVKYQTADGVYHDGPSAINVNGTTSSSITYTDQNGNINQMQIKNGMRPTNYVATVSSPSTNNSLSIDTLSNYCAVHIEIFGRLARWLRSPFRVRFRPTYENGFISLIMFPLRLPVMLYVVLVSLIGAILNFVTSLIVSITLGIVGMILAFCAFFLFMALLFSLVLSI